MNIMPIMGVMFFDGAIQEPFGKASASNILQYLFQL